MGVEEWFFLYGVALNAAHVTPGNVELACSIESNLANPGSAFGDRAAMAARETADSPIVELLIKLAFANIVIKNVSHGRHGYSFPGKPQLIASRLRSEFK